MERGEMFSEEGRGIMIFVSRLVDMGDIYL